MDFLIPERYDCLAIRVLQFVVWDWNANFVFQQSTTILNTLLQITKGATCEKGQVYKKPTAAHFKLFFLYFMEIRQ